MQLEDIRFLIVGATKSATTWLQQSLQRHPAVYMPDPELHYFSRYYDRGASWYLSQFEPGDHRRRLIGEKSNSYMDTPDAAGRIRRDLPQVQLIAQLRNPIERAYSDYCMLYRRGEVGRDIEQYLDPRVADGGRFLNGGLYYRQLCGFLEVFPADRFLILLFEDIRTQPQRQLDMVGAFLKLEGDLAIPPAEEKVKDKTQAVIGPHLRRILSPLKPLVKPIRQTGAFAAVRSLVAKELNYPALKPDLRSRLIEYYAGEVEQLGKSTGRDFSPWLEAR
ncbi:sulfotransferase domain-containing protein [Rhizobium sp. TRM95111]|uniref:sulfotransferase family protein n=1 Tax=Rhizobium alarense TaxID=2846851 RepID=UPI001F2CCF05|nr:sulfotransferase [Rhizobium alarense]MCF3641806.1 sulfotransferase domain-containing protein [Rhizobium alarense]